MEMGIGKRKLHLNAPQSLQLTDLQRACTFCTCVRENNPPYLQVILVHSCVFFHNVVFDIKKDIKSCKETEGEEAWKEKTA